MATRVQTINPANSPDPIGPYSHIARVGEHLTIGGLAGVDPETGKLAGPDAYSQSRRILASFRAMLQSVGSDLDHITHVTVYLLDMADFEAMNRAYIEAMGGHRPARTTVGVASLPKAGAVVTMSLTAVTRNHSTGPA